MVEQCTGLSKARAISANVWTDALAAGDLAWRAQRAALILCAGLRLPAIHALRLMGTTQLRVLILQTSQRPALIANDGVGYYNGGKINIFRKSHADMARVKVFGRASL